MERQAFLVSEFTSVAVCVEMAVSSWDSFGMLNVCNFLKKMG